MPVSRLPIVGSDTNTWGTVLNDWLTKTTVPATNVQVNGATGNGVTDDTAAFALARDAAGVNGMVEVPPGTYVLSGFAWNVAGQSWRICRGATLLTKPSSGTTELGTVSATNVTLSGGGVLDGNRANTTAGAAQDILKVNATLFTLTAMVLQNGSQAGVELGISGSFSGLTIMGCRFSNIGLAAIMAQGGVNADTDGVLITGNVIDQYAATPFNAANAPNAIQFWNSPASHILTNVVIADNYLRCYPYLNTEYANTNACIVMSAVSNYVVSGNSLNGAGFAMSIVNCNYGAISGNTVTGWSIYGLEMSNYCTVTGNTFNSTDPRAATGTHAVAALICDQTAGQFLSVTGNQFYHVASDTLLSVHIQPQAANGINHVTVADNQIYRLGGGTAMQFDRAASFITIRGNTIDSNGQFANVIWIASDNAASPVTQYGVSVTDNVISNYSTGAGLLWGQTGSLNAVALDYAIFANNIFRSGTTGIGTVGSPASGSHCNIAAGSNIGP